MNVKKIMTSVMALTLAFGTMAGMAHAKDVGKWTEYISEHASFTGTNTRTKDQTYESAIINVRHSDSGYITNTGATAMSLTPDAPGDPAGMNWQVLMYDGNTKKYEKATALESIFDNKRLPASYNSTYNGRKGSCKLYLYNYNSSVIKTHGSWCPNE